MTLYLSLIITITDRLLTSFVPGVSGGPDRAVGHLEQEVGPLVAGVDLDEGVAVVLVGDVIGLRVGLHPRHLGGRYTYDVRIGWEGRRVK